MACTGGFTPPARRFGNDFLVLVGHEFARQGAEALLQPFEVARQQLLRLVWEHDYLGDSRLVDACVQRLRAKVEDVPSSPSLIRTVRGVGYRLDAPQ